MTWALIVVFLNANQIWDTGMRADSLEGCSDVRAGIVEQYRRDGQSISGAFQCVPVHAEALSQGQPAGDE